MARASHALMTELTAALEQSGISPREHSVLVTAMTGSYTQTELARMVGLDKTTMVVTIDDLEAAGLAERRPSSTDRRARVIAVTPAGARKVRAAEKVLDQVRDDVLAALPDDERDVFLRALGSARVRTAVGAGGVRATGSPPQLDPRAALASSSANA